MSKSLARPHAQRLGAIKPINPIKPIKHKNRKNLRDELQMSDFPKMEYKDEGDQVELGPDARALDLLQVVYRSSRQPLAVRMRAAALAIPFESPKLTAMAVSSMDGDHFAAMLERAIARSKEPLTIEHQPNDRPLPEAPPPGIRGRSGAGR